MDFWGNMYLSSLFLHDLAWLQGSVLLMLFDDGWMGGWMDVKTEIGMDGGRDAWIDEGMDEWMEGWMDGQMYKWMDTGMDGGTCILWLRAPFLHHSNLLFPLAHFLLPLCSQIPFFVPFIRTLGVMFRTHVDNSQLFPHFKILNYICNVPFPYSVPFTGSRD